MFPGQRYTQTYQARVFSFRTVFEGLQKLVCSRLLHSLIQRFHFLNKEKITKWSEWKTPLVNFVQNAILTNDRQEICSSLVGDWSRWPNKLKLISHWELGRTICPGYHFQPIVYMKMGLDLSSGQIVLSFSQQNITRLSGLPFFDPACFATSVSPSQRPILRNMYW